jgi:hypothetical protein
MKYEYLTVDNAKVGDKVVLANPNPCYSVGNSVEWDNKSGNIYVDNELALSKRKSIMGGTENGKYTSIW